MESETTNVCVVIGAAGRLGRLLVDRALVHGMKVRALVRPGRQYADTRQNVEVMEVNLEVPKDIMKLLEYSDVVFSAVRSHSKFFSNQNMVRYVRNICEALITNDYEFRPNMPSRFVICSCISATEEGRSKMSFLSKLGLFFQRGRVKELEMLEILAFKRGHPEFLNKLSVPFFTIVRPTTLTDDPKSDVAVGYYEDGCCQNLRSSIPRLNVVDFMFDECFLKGVMQHGSAMIGLKP